MRLSRHFMYQRISEFFVTTRAGKVLCISGTGPIAKMFYPGSEIENARYPAVDVLNLPYTDGTYDFVVCDQVLEHVRNPWMAVRQMHRVLKPGGWMILTTCLMNPIHKNPTDYWRFTPDGLQELCRDFGAVDQCEGWGNGEALDLIVNKGMRFQEVPPDGPFRKLAEKNDGVNLIHVWIICRK